jgi:hypothetical protein
MHGNNTRNLPVYLSLSQTSQNAIFFFLSFIFFFFFKIGEQEGRTGSAQRQDGRDEGGKGEVAQQCIHM